MEEGKQGKRDREERLEGGRKGGKGKVEKVRRGEKTRSWGGREKGREMKGRTRSADAGIGRREGRGMREGGKVARER